MTNLTRLRPYLVLQILNENTDENHTLTIAQISRILEEKYGIKNPYRATIKEDIELLQAAGCDIEFIKSSQNRYHIVSREFDIAELKILIDAVESSKFITKEKSGELAAKLSAFAGPFRAEELKRNIDVERRAKPGNGKIYYIVDAINEAINAKKKISFRYFSYNVKKKQELRHGGYEYVFSPYRLVWNGDCYYVIGFSDRHEKVVTFRVDRICDVPMILDDDARKKPRTFSLNSYLNSMFGMFDGTREDIELICSNDVVDSIIDRFGTGVRIVPDGSDSFRINVNTAASHVFFSWIFGFGGKVRIAGPENVKRQYREMVLKAAEDLNK